MGIFDHLFDSEYRQRNDINRQAEKIQSVQSSMYRESDRLTERIRVLEGENAETKLVCMTLLQTLVQHDLITKESFIELAQKIKVEADEHTPNSRLKIIPESVMSPPKKSVSIDFSQARQKP